MDPALERSLTQRKLDQLRQRRYNYTIIDIIDRTEFVSLSQVIKEKKKKEEEESHKFRTREWYYLEMTELCILTQLKRLSSSSR